MNCEKIDRILQEECIPIIGLIDERIDNAIKENISPQSLLMSVKSYICLKFALKPFYAPFYIYPDSGEFANYKGMQIIVDHEMKDNDFRIIGSIKDEMRHKSNFKEVS